MISLNQWKPPGEGVSSGSAGPSNLILRTASALVLAPVVVVAAFTGGWVFSGLCVLAATGILWEWTRLVAGRSDARTLVPGVTALFAAWLLADRGEAQAAIGAITVGAALAGGLTAFAPGPATSPRKPAWAAFGTLYAGAAFLGPALLRGYGTWGFKAILFLAGTVWMTDILAYVVGRTIGGPRLWPSISPKKTWAGAIGGAIGGIAGGLGVAYASGLGNPGILGSLALLLSVFAQGGDLLESAIKRHFGAKDASHLIPGHGGLMDRLDGFLIAALVALAIGMLRQGTDAPGQGLLLW